MLRIINLYTVQMILFGKASNTTLLQSNQVKHTPQDCINELITLFFFYKNLFYKNVEAEIDPNFKGKCLGSGGWGKVVKGKYCGCTVAIKQIYEDLLKSSPYYRELFEREMNIASRCRHPCLLQFIGATNDEESPLFVTELMETSLRKLVEKRPLSRSETSVISLDVARALNYLHLKKPRPIIHRDISSANVLLWQQNDQWRGKVSDYGAANFTKTTMTACPGAVIYSAPGAFTEHQNLKVFLLLCLKLIVSMKRNRNRKETNKYMLFASVICLCYINCIMIFKTSVTVFHYTDLPAGK